MLRARGSIVGADIVRAVWVAVPSEVKIGLLALGLRDPGDMTLGQMAWLLPLACHTPASARVVH